MVFRPAQSLLTQGIAAQQTQNRWMEKRQTDKQQIWETLVHQILLAKKTRRSWFTSGESPLQDVDFENFWTFVRVAYVCIHVCVHVCIKSVCEGMDPHSFLGNGQFKILAFLTFRLCCDKMVSELAQYSMDNPAGVQPGCL